MNEETIRQLKKELGKIVRDRERFYIATWAVAVIALLLISQQPVKKKKRKPSKWNLFFGKMLKQGFTAKEAAENWKNLKAKK